MGVFLSRFMKRSLMTATLLPVVVLLSGCKSDWEYVKNEDPMYGVSHHLLSHGIDQNGKVSKTVAILIGCMPTGYPMASLLTGVVMPVMRGPGYQVTIKFDDGQPETYRMRSNGDHPYTVNSLGLSKEIMEKIEDSKVIHIEYSDVMDTRLMKFNVQGLAKEMSTLQKKGCKSGWE